VRWAQAGAACVVVTTALLTAGLVVGRGPAVYLVVALSALVGVAWLVLEDSKARGRRGGRWLAGCIVLGPVGLSAFLVVAVLDRARGRLGIEGRWPSPGRWCFLAGAVMGIAAASIALAPLSVQGVRFSSPGTSADITGSCSSALSISLAGVPYNTSAVPDVAGGLTRVLAADNTVDNRCSVAASRRLGLSTLCLVGALLVSLAGAGMSRRLASAHIPSGV